MFFSGALIPPDVRSHSGDEVRASPGQNRAAYRVIVPCAFVFWVVFYVTLTVVVNGLIAWITTSQPDASVFEEAQSWCLVFEKQVLDPSGDYVNNPCIESDLFWDSAAAVDPSNYFGTHERCEYDLGADQPAVNFCSTSPETTWHWCETIFKQVTNPNASTYCGYMYMEYLDSSNFSLYSSEYLDYDDDGDDYSYTWMWVYPAMLNLILILVFVQVFTFPRTIQRDGDSFVVKSCCGTDRIPLGVVQQIIAFDRFNWCLHRYILRGLRYLTFSCWRGSYANNTPLILLITPGCTANSYRLSLSPPDYQAFMADNIAPAAATPAVGMGYGTVAVRTEVAVDVQAHIPIATVAQQTKSYV